MSVNGDVSEQVVKLSLEGFEVFVKLTGNGTKNIAALLYTILKDQKQTKGKTRLNNMLKTPKPLKIFSIKKEDLKMFSKEAKKYGILYCVLMDKKSKDFDGMVDIMVKEEDASRINRIVERFKLATVDTARIKTEVTKSIEDRKVKNDEFGTKEKSKEEQLEDVLSTSKPLSKNKLTKENFNLAKTEKDPQSEPSLTTLKMRVGASKKEDKPSVRKELAKLKVEAKNNYEIRVKQKSGIKNTKTSQKRRKTR